MTREEFISQCTLSGYCTKEQAAKYADDEDRETFSESDFIRAYRRYNKFPNTWVSGSDGGDKYWY